MFRANLELQQRLSESRRAAAVGAITEGIAHNLNNLLGVVVGYLDLIKVGLDKPEKIERSVGLMDSAINRMTHIIRQLGSIASDESMDLQPINLRDLVAGSIQRFKREYGVPAEVKSITTIPADFKAEANLEAFETSLGSLLINAWESYDEDHEGPRPIILESNILKEWNRRYLQISVIDEGQGIDPEVADTLFEPFITTKTSVGRGMGLTIARHTLRNMGADLQIRDRDDGGVIAEIRFLL
jgi:signal transduction histidine kinase